MEMLAADSVSRAQWMGKLALVLESLAHRTIMCHRESDGVGEVEVSSMMINVSQS